MLGGEEAARISVAEACLASYKGNIDAVVAPVAENGSVQGRVAALELLGRRGATSRADVVLKAAGDLNPTVAKAASDALAGVVTDKDLPALYSLLEDPMTSCGCFECICGIEPCSMGVVITCREYAGITPLGMTFSEMASMTGGGVQTPGFMGHGKHFIASHKFIAAEGGPGRIVWLPKILKDQMRERLDKTALEMYGVENFTDMIADETICTEDPEQLLNFLSEVGHPVLSMEPFDM